MDINAIMSTQVAELQQTLQMSLLNQSMTGTAQSVDKLLETMPQPAAPHPYKGASIDISI